MSGLSSTPAVVTKDSITTDKFEVIYQQNKRAEPKPKPSKAEMKEALTLKGVRATYVGEKAYIEACQNALIKFILSEKGKEDFQVCTCTCVLACGCTPRPSHSPSRDRSHSHLAECPTG